ncbi:hypothetical protein, partial [Streptomyces sp. NRRL WC-3742]|uniref:hypothetical protein n=1 Tax=Streptomyces sp. NRRL WC-3742 TaxID=1463934 RepID=UPI00056D021F
GFPGFTAAFFTTGFDAAAFRTLLSAMHEGYAEPQAPWRRISHKPLAGSTAPPVAPILATSRRSAPNFAGPC